MDLTSPTVIDHITGKNALAFYLIYLFHALNEIFLILNMILYLVVTPVQPSPKSFASIYFYASTKLPDEIVISRFSKSP